MIRTTDTGSGTVTVHCFSASKQYVIARTLSTYVFCQFWLVPRRLSQVYVGRGCARAAQTLPHDVLTLIKLLLITVIQPLQIINLLPLILLLLRFIHQLLLSILELIFQIIIQLAQISPLWLIWLDFTHFIGNAICLVI